MNNPINNTNVGNMPAQKGEKPLIKIKYVNLDLMFGSNQFILANKNSSENEGGTNIIKVSSSNNNNSVNSFGNNQPKPPSSNSTNVSTPITSVAIEEIEKINDKFVKDENNFLDNLNEIKTEIVTVNDSSFNVSQNEVRENNSNINNDIQNVLQIVIDDKKNLDLSIDASANLLSQQSDTTLNNDTDTDDKKNAVNFINKQE